MSEKIESAGEPQAFNMISELECSPHVRHVWRISVQLRNEHSGKIITSFQMENKAQCIRAFFQRFGAKYDLTSQQLEDYKHYLMFDCDFTSDHAEFVCSIVPSKDVECRINGAFFLTIFSPASGMMTTDHHKKFGFHTCAFFADVCTADKLAIKSDKKERLLVADYVNRHSGDTESSYEWSFPFESGLYGLASAGTNFDFWVETAHPNSGIKALRREWDAFFKKQT